MAARIERPVTGPATHAVIIGVGGYPHLIDGAAPAPEEVTGGMGQLGSPPISARAFTDWLLCNFHHPGRPVGSVELLLSGGSDNRYIEPGGPVYEAEEATLANIRAAVQRWKTIGDQNPDNLLIFFFSGHGIEAGARHTLLASDYGAVPGRHMLGAIDFNQFRVGMQSCKAKQQLYFIDACRAANDALVRESANETGDVLVASRLPVAAELEQSAYFAALAGKGAYGAEDKPSLFTDALLKALIGPGASDADGDGWWVNTSRLQEALNHFASLLADPINGSVQKPISGHTTFAITKLRQEPVVPVYFQPEWHIGQEPPAEVVRVSVALEGTVVKEWASPWDPSDEIQWAPSRFCSWLAVGGRYAFEMETPTEQLGRTDWYVGTPFKLVRVRADGDD